MKIKYVHFADPGVVKIHDTEKSLKGCAGFLNIMGSVPTQEEWDMRQLRAFEQNKENGFILAYEVIEEKETKV